MVSSSSELGVDPEECLGINRNGTEMSLTNYLHPRERTYHIHTLIVYYD